jgi:predicted RNase H-like nuclease (RuvC/YqgF family)
VKWTREELERTRRKYSESERQLKLEQQRREQEVVELKTEFYALKEVVERLQHAIRDSSHGLFISSQVASLANLPLKENCMSRRPPRLFLPD